MFIIEKGILLPSAIRLPVVWRFVSRMNNIDQAINAVQRIPRDEPNILAMRVIDEYTGRVLVSAELFDPIPVARLQDAAALTLF